MAQEKNTKELKTSPETPSQAKTNCIAQPVPREANVKKNEILTELRKKSGFIWMA